MPAILAYADPASRPGPVPVGPAAGPERGSPGGTRLNPAPTTFFDTFSDRGTL